MAMGFDLVGIFLLVIMAVSGLKKGLIDGILKIGGMYAAMYVSMNYSAHALIIVEPLISIPESYKTIAGYGIAFLATMYSFTLLGFILKKIVKTMNLGIVDRIGGITLGISKAGLLLSAVVWAFAMVPAETRGDWQEESKLYPFVEVFAGQVVYVFSLEDELAMLQTMIDPDADKTELLQSVLGGEDGDGMSPDIMKALGAGDGGDKTDILKKALESMGGSQSGLMEQVMKSAGVDDLSDMDIMEEVEKLKHVGTNRQAEMDRIMDEIEAEAQGRKK